MKRICKGTFVAGLAGQLATAALTPAYAVAIPVLPETVLDKAVQAFPEGFLLVQSIPEGEFSEPAPTPSISSNPYADERDPNLSTTHDFDDQTTSGVSGMIDRGVVECAQMLRPQYRIDCLRNLLARAASTIENRPNYREAARDLRALSRQLDDIVERYQDTSAPRATVKQRSYRAVTQASLDEANREATAAIEETVTKLLRSAGNSEKRKNHYAQISRAVGSSKTLLRS